MKKHTFYKPLKGCLVIVIVLGWLVFHGTAIAIPGSNAKKIHEVMVKTSYTNLTIKSILEDIESKTDFVFTYDKNDSFLNIPISKPAGRYSVGRILDEIGKTTGVMYQQINYNISLKRIVPTPKIPTDVKQNLEVQEIKVSGTVLDENGQTLPGVSVVAKGTQNGTLSDVNGQFSMNVEDTNAILVLSFVGYQTQEVTIGTKTNIEVTMLTDISTLGEVIVVGYGTQKKVNLTGAVNTVSSKELANRPINNLDQALQGLSPGLNIASNPSLGGEPNARMNLNIRGIGSLSGGGPWILVDGTPMDMNAINPADVESVTILKDAASTAIYGSRAAYGVILITTKSGKGTEKLSTSYSNNFSWAQPTNLPGFVNSLKFANSINEAATNSGQNAIFSDETIDRIIRYQADPVNTPSMVADPRDPNGWGYWNLGNGNTDWWDVLFKDFAFSQRHNVGISGSSKNTNYYLGVGWLNDAGKLNFANEKFERFNLASNISMKITDKFTVLLKTKFNRSNQRFMTSQDVNNRHANFNMMTLSWPTDPIYTPNGDYTLDKNLPAVLENGGNDQQYTTDLWVNPSIEFRPTKDWKINADLSYNFYGYKRGHHRAVVWGLATDGITPIRHYSQNWNRMSQVVAHNEYFTSNIYTDYSKQFNNHFFSIMVGGQAESANDMLLGGWRRDLVTESVPSIRTAIGDRDIYDNMTHWSTLGSFMRFTYNYNEKYLLEINGRYDGSSRFQKGRRWGFFPSAAIGYNIWKEDFWQPMENTINTLKIRGSYGRLGNQNVANYLHEETIPIMTNLPWIMNGIRPVYTTIPSNRSTGLSWETSESTNIGLDAEALKNRLTLTFDWYIRKTKDMFGPGETLPAIYGANVPLKNNATLQTNGIELSVNWKNSINNNLDYSVGLAFSDNKTKIKKYNNPTKLITNFYEGQTYGEVWGFETEGLFQSSQEAADWADQSELYSIWGAGDVKYKDLNGDGKITRGSQTLSDHGDLKVIGNTMPRYLFGINAGINYKSFDFSLFLQGVGKRDLWMSNQAFFGFGGGWTSVVLQEHSINFWSPENPNGYFARPYLTAENFKNQQVQSQYLQDASYIRLKNLQLGYTVPSRIINKIGIEKVRIYVSGENVFTISNILKSFDPEANVSSAASPLVYPLSRSLSTGLNITF